MSTRQFVRSLTRIALGSALLLGACTVSSVEPDPNNNNNNNNNNNGDPIAISGTITQSATWSGNIQIVDETIIAPGVTITVEAGSSLQGAQMAALRVEGVLTIEGTADSKVTMGPLADVAWSGIVVEAGGDARINHATGQDIATVLYCHEGALYCGMNAVEFISIGSAMNTSAPSSIEASTLVEMDNGGITVGAGGDLTITDSYVLTSTHDLIVTRGGSKLTIDHSEIGGAVGSYEHCNLHIGSADELTVTNSNLISSVVGIMLGGTSGATITGNNFELNESLDFQEIGTNTQVDLSNNYWAAGPPNVDPNIYTLEPTAQARFEAAGPRI